MLHKTWSTISPLHKKRAYSPYFPQMLLWTLCDVTTGVNIGTCSFHFLNDETNKLIRSNENQFVKCLSLQRIYKQLHDVCVYIVRCLLNLKKNNNNAICPSYLYIFMLFGFLWLSQYLARKKSSTYQTTAYTCRRSLGKIGQRIELPPTFLGR